MAPYMVAAFNLSCPSHSERYLRSKGKCTDYYSYTCLFDENLNAFTESCTIKFDFQRPGYRVTIRTNLHAGTCPGNLYQPFTFFTNSSSNCELKRSFCSEEGQIVSGNGTTRTDRQCRCDYSLGYSYVNTPRNVCACLPSEEDCSCYRKTCSKHNILSPDYICINQSTWSGKFMCSSISGMRFPKVIGSSNTKDLFRVVLGTTRTTVKLIITVLILLVLTYIIISTALGHIEEQCSNLVDKQHINTTVSSNEMYSQADDYQLAIIGDSSESGEYETADDISISETPASRPENDKLRSFRLINRKKVKKKKTTRNEIFQIQHEVFKKELIKQDKEIEKLNLQIEILKKS